MSLCKSSGLGIFAVICLLVETSGSAHAQCNLFFGLWVPVRWKDIREE